MFSYECMFKRLKANQAETAGFGEPDARLNERQRREVSLNERQRRRAGFSQTSVFSSV